jgi:hypothetical protein
MKNKEFKKIEKSLKKQYFNKTGKKAKKNKDIYLNFISYLATDIEGYILGNKKLFFDKNDIEKLLFLCYKKEIEIYNIDDLSACEYLSARENADTIALNILNNFLKTK